MKKIYLAVALAACAFFACTNIEDEDDDDSLKSSSSSGPSSNSNSGTSGVCYVDTGIADLKMCLEGISEPMFSSDCVELAIETGYVTNFLASCPSEYQLKCLGEERYGNGKAYTYIYGQIVPIMGLTCDEMDYEEVNYTDVTSINSSSSSSLAAGVCYDNDGYCYESKTGTITSYECMGYGGTPMNSCPSGYRLKCYDDYYDEYNYIYNTYGSTCEDYDMYPITSTPSSSSRPSSSSAYYYPSSSSNLAAGVCYDIDGYCYESRTGTITSYECMGYGGTPMNSCPSNYRLKCYDDYFDEYNYIYNTYGSTCEDYDMYPITSTPSSSSRPSSSSNSGTSGACYVSNIPNTLDLAMCAQGDTESFTSYECEYLAYEWGGGTPSIKNSCPTGEVLKCDIDGGYFYIYGQIATLLGITCDALNEPSEKSFKAKAKKFKLPL